jgi:uncharacterized protein DUF2252
MATFESDLLAYENWLRKHCEVVEDDLRAKHRRMAESPFKFLRATYFRWACSIESLCPELAAAPTVLAMGDIHVENYGTWRDADARLVWGINDFDDVAVMPYAYDLVRLATSALLAPDHRSSETDVAAAILEGYRKGLASPRALLLDEHSGWMRGFANPTDESNKDFWREVDDYPDADPPALVRQTLQKSLPKGAEMRRYASRRKGGGSLGRPRFVVIADWHSGRVLREAKALVPSAWHWAHKTTGRRGLFIEAAYAPFRSPDPFLRREADWIIRRIAPDSRKIEIADLHAQGLTLSLLAAMAADLAAIHAASPSAAAIPDDLDARDPKWLYRAAEVAVAATERDAASYAKR